MSEVKKWWETQEVMIPSTDLPKEWNKKYDPEVYKRLLDKVKRLEAEDEHWKNYISDDINLRINQYPEPDKLYPEDKRILIEELPKKQIIDYIEPDPNDEYENVREKREKIREMLAAKIIEIESLLTDLGKRKKQIEWKGDEVSFQWDLDILFTKISLAYFLVENIDGQESISRLHKLESQAMNLWWDK